MTSDTALAWSLIAAAALWTVNCMIYVSRIGKERQPIEAKYAAFDLLINAGIIVVAVMAAVRLFHAG